MIETMGRIARSFTDLIGNPPLSELKKPEKKFSPDPYENDIIWKGNLPIN